MKANEPLPGEESANSPRSILVIDDDHDVRQLSVDVLAGAGYEVEAVADGVAGWKALQAGHYDLIIADHKLIGMTGMAIVEKLRAAAMAIPVIIAARYLPTLEFARKPWLKPVVMLQRPFTNDDLLGAVTKTLRPASHGATPPFSGATKREPALALAGQT